MVKKVWIYPLLAHMLQKQFTHIVRKVFVHKSLSIGKLRLLGLWDMWVFWVVRGQWMSCGYIVWATILWRKKVNALENFLGALENFVWVHWRKRLDALDLYKVGCTREFFLGALAKKAGCTRELFLVVPHVNRRLCASCWAFSIPTVVRLKYKMQIEINKNIDVDALVVNLCCKSISHKFCPKEICRKTRSLGGPPGPDF